MKFKKIIALTIALSSLHSGICTVFASDEVVPKIIVNDRMIGFHDQSPVISETERVLVPLRGVFEAMGAEVRWEESTRSVYVQSKDNIHRMRLYIDNPVMTKYTLTSITTVENKEITLDTPPTIMNDRTMIPLRVVSENMNDDVSWDDATKTVTIKTKEYNKYIEGVVAENEGMSVENYDPKKTMPYFYIESDKTTAEAGEIVTISLKVANTDKIEGYSLYSGMSAGFFYDDEKLSVASTTAVVNGVVTTNILGANNPEFMNNSLKYVYIVMPGTDADQTLTDGTIATVNFEVLQEGATEVSLSNRITTHIGHDTSLLVADDKHNSISLDKPEDLYIDTTPIIING